MPCVCATLRHFRTVCPRLASGQGCAGPDLADLVCRRRQSPASSRAVARSDGVTGGPGLATPPPRLARSIDGYTDVSVDSFLFHRGGHVSIDYVYGQPDEPT